MFEFRLWNSAFFEGNPKALYANRRRSFVFVSLLLQAVLLVARVGTLFLYRGLTTCPGRARVDMVWRDSRWTNTRKPVLPEGVWGYTITP